MQYECSPYQRKILRTIAKHKSGISAEAILKKIGEQAVDAADDLRADGYLEREETEADRCARQKSKIAYIGFETGDYKITDEGKRLLAETKEVIRLSSRQKWLERLWGFISGVAVSMIAWGLGHL